ncbi:ephrin-A4 [Sparus aurata]|uniref:Ephrin-A4 n=1 Tax=Sparus aurata TaxID=8175 RepID=A0A671W8C5_SPAAU|nr:ephrin-A4-like [Sparus aurata]
MGSPVRTPGALPAWKATIFLFNIISAAVAKRHVVYWNSTNTRLTAGDLSIQVNLNDYLDIYCPHYPSKGAQGPAPPETLALYLVGEASFQGCVETRGAIKRWECNTPHAPYGPVRFSEKIQRFTPFSLGFEFLPGRHYYYSSLPTDEGPPLPCMKLRVTVCCEPTSEGSKQIQETAAQSSVCSLRTSSPPLLLLLLIPVLLLLTT